ncbi:MAG TPA: hypothetical protein VFJ18_00550, partial [Pararhizobium sp.]|nr:hypothetical protein [Pararhizobium sp.]
VALECLRLCFGFVCWLDSTVAVPDAVVPIVVPAAPGVVVDCSALASDGGGGSAAALGAASLKAAVLLQPASADMTSAHARPVRIPRPLFKPVGFRPTATPAPKNTVITPI